MKRAFTASALFVVVLLTIAFGCRSGGGGDLSKPETQKQFGVRMAKMNLWREAMFRFQRAVQMDPNDAMAHNNLAVAYEANGDFDNAAKEYREALRLDRTNQYIQKNYSRFVEFTSRAKKRQQGGKVAGSETTPAIATTPSIARTPTTATSGTTGTTDTGLPEPLIPPTDTTPTSPPPGGFE